MYQSHQILQFVSLDNCIFSLQRFHKAQRWGGSCLAGSWPWLPELIDGSSGCSCPWVEAVQWYGNTQHCRELDLCCGLGAGPGAWPQEYPVCAAVPSAAVQEVLSIACPAPAS